MNLLKKFGNSAIHFEEMDAVKRREARRKRLLESSEDRFKRIERLKMKSQELDEAPCDCVGSSEQSSLNDLSKSAPEAIMQQPSASEEQRASTGQTAEREEDSQTHSTKSSLPSHHASGHYSCHHVDRKDSQDNRTETSPAPSGVEENKLPRDISQDSGFVDSASSTQSRSHLCDQKETQHQSKDVEMSTKGAVSFQTLVFTLLAVVTRLWLVTLLHGQSIIVLFFATKVFLFSTGLEQSPVQSGPIGIIMTLLTFKGVSPQTVQSVQRCLVYLQGILRDFSTFLFVFVMVHAAIEWSSSPDLGQVESVGEV